MDEKVGNDAVVEWLAGEWILRNPEKTLRKVASAFECRGNVCYACNAFTRAGTFVVGEKEQAVSLDWTTDRPAKLVTDVLRLWLSCGSEEVTCVERGIAMKLE